MCSTYQESHLRFLSQQLPNANSLWARGVPWYPLYLLHAGMRSGVQIFWMLSPSYESTRVVVLLIWIIYFPKVIYHLWLLQCFFLPLLQWSLSLGREGSDRCLLALSPSQSLALWVSVLLSTARGLLTCWMLRDALIYGIRINHQESLSFNTMPI